MFQLTNEEFENWKSQIVTSNSIIMGARKLPNAYTENGIAMLSGVLNSQTAIRVNIEIMRASLKDLGKKLFAFSKLNIPPSAIL